MNSTSVTAGSATAPLLSGVTTGSALIYPTGQSKALTVIAQGTAATGAITTGVITIEEAVAVPGGPLPAGTWSSITTISGADLTTGAIKAVHVLQSSFSVVRVRVSTATSTGAVDIFAWTN